jgi:ribonucleoside-diphosphate reductase alpha chain
LYQDSWCEHKPSITVYVKEHEWPEVGAWVWRNFDDVSGVSFLPHSEHTYRQAPYQEITEEEYAAFCAKMPKDVDWSGLGKYETEDRTAGAQTLACSGVSCEIVDLTEG